MKNMKTLPPVAVGTAVALLGYSLITGGNLLREVWGGASGTHPPSSSSIRESE